MELIEGEQVLYRARPSARASIGFYFRWLPLALFPGILFSIVSAGGWGTGFPLWRWWLLSVILVLVVIIVDGIRRLSIVYSVTTERLHIRRGILSRVEQSTNIDRVQNVNVSQSVIDRALNVGTVDFDTAGTDSRDASFRFVGVADPTALVTRVQRFKIESERDTQ